MLHRHLRSLLAITTLATAVGAESTAGTAVPDPASTPSPAPTAGEDPATTVLVVEGRADSLVGSADSAAVGTVGVDELSTRPFLRPAEVLETVPGMIASQHSGTGKANQYYLRGFNLDHGTDFATSIDGMPVNFPTHAHGQGYTDLNFLIPEIIDTVDYRKGVYYADVGDFSSAGSADIHLAERLDRGTALLGAGTHDYQRALIADAPALGAGHLLYAGEYEHDDGAWVHGDDFRKYNGVVRYAGGDRDAGWSLTGMAYHATWDSTDQIPARAVDQGLIDRLGAIDPSDGGTTTRISLSGDLRIGDAQASTDISLYAIAYRLHLWSDFTYFLDDPVNGDQFEQSDRRYVGGGQITHRWKMDAGVPLDNRIGIQIRDDVIPQVEIDHTRDREVLSTVRSDQVQQQSVGVFADSTQRWTRWLRTQPGLRADVYRFDVFSDIAQNSGTRTAGIVSPKLNTVLGPWAESEFYVNLGFGFHSNDARGTTVTVDPADPAQPLQPVKPLVRSRGAEIGARTSAVPGLQSTLDVWVLALDSELVFSGDAGDTEPNRASRRIGVEWANYWIPLPAWTIDADYAYTVARFTEDDPVGDHIPGSPEQIAAAGVTYGLPTGPFATLRLRFFGPRPLIEDDSVRSRATTLVNAAVGYRRERWMAQVEVLNLLDSHDHDVDYFYASRLQGEPAGGVDDVHYHPVEPITLRGSVAWRF